MSFIGEAISFWAARFLGRDFVELFVNERIGRIKKKIEDNGFKILLMWRFIPLFPFAVIGYAAGLSRFNFFEYMIATFLGMLPGTVLYTYLFATAGEQILTEGLTTELLRTEVIIPFILLIILLFASLWYQKKTQ